ncbi:DUF445 family protein [Vallitaleaceae bacterium 9-2]
MDITTIITPIAGSIIGYTTNWLAIKMLFKPHKPIYIGKLKLPFTPGVIPREQKRIAKSLGSAVGNNLLTEEVILKELTNDQVIEQLETYIVQNLLAKPLCIEEFVQHIYSEDDARDAFYEKIARIVQEQLIKQLANNQELKNQLFAMIARKVPYSKKINEIIGENISAKIKEQILLHKEDIANYIVALLQEENAKIQIIQVIDQILSEKLGGLAAMFVQPESLYTMLIDYLQAYLAVEENQEQMGTFICEKIDGFLEKEISSMVSSKDYIHLTEQLVDFVEHELVDVLNSEVIQKQIQNYLITLSKIEIQLSEDMKQSFAKAICGLYKNFAQTHLPVFIQQFNITRIVENEINHFSVAEVERLIFTIVDKELKAITWFGALLGFIMGLLTLLV